jgi:hypothetical protein
MSDAEKQNARFYSGGQVVSFARDNAGLGIAQGAEYRVVGLGRDANGRQIVKLADEHGRIIRWDPRLGSVRQVNVFNKPEGRALAEGDRIQWRLANKELGLKNAERGTVEKLEDAGHHSLGPGQACAGCRSGPASDLGPWLCRDGLFSAVQKLCPRLCAGSLDSPLVNGQNYYTAITRARYGVKLWTEDVDRLATRLAERSGEKTSALEGLGRLDRDHAKSFAERHPERMREARDEQGACCRSAVTAP